MSVNMIAALIAQRERMALSATDVDRPKGHGPIGDDPVPYIREVYFVPNQPVTEFRRDDKDRRGGTPIIDTSLPDPNRPRTREEILAHNERVCVERDEGRYENMRKYGG